MFGLNPHNWQKPTTIKTETNRVPFYKKKKFWAVLLTIIAGLIAGSLSYSDALRQGAELFMNN